MRAKPNQTLSLLPPPPTVWIKPHGCNAGLTNQKYGVWHFLAAMQVVIPNLPDDVEVVIVAPYVWVAIRPPFARGIPGRCV